MRLFVPGAEVPVLRDADVVVVGGSLAGIAAAVAVARTGASVMIAEPATYLGGEVTATLRLWLEGEDLVADDPSGVLTVLRQGRSFAGKIAPIWPDAAKRGLESLLEHEGVGLLYGSRAIALQRDPRGVVVGVVVADKSGRQLLRARRVLVSSECGALLGSVPSPEADRVLTIETTGSGLAISGSQRLQGLPPGLGLRDDAVTLRPGYRGAGHVLVEASLIASSDGVDDRHRVRRRGVDVFAAMIEREAFAGSWLAGVSFRPASLIAEPAELPPEVSWVRGADPTAEPGLAQLLRDAAATGRRTTDSARELEHARTVHATASDDTGADACEMLRVSEPLPPQHWGAPVDAVAPMPVDRVLEADVIVVGGGSSGASCAAAAAGDGARTILIDANPGLGGTGTFGGVDSYWFGRRDGLAAPMRAAVRERHRALGLDGGAGRGWNIEAKADALLHAVETVGVEIVTDATAFAVLRAARAVTGVIVATPEGVLVARAPVVVDCTGDADVAYAAGAPVRHGADRTHSVMWYSLAQFTEPGRTRNNFGGMVDVGDVEDLTRAIVAARRRGGDLHDHGIYVAARESRNIVGDATVTMTDQLVRRHVPDVVNVHFSNHDIKGKSESIWTLMGLIPPNLEIEIPYGSLLPQGVDGLIVAGKALSTTHDGLAAVRMQSDLENLGAVAGIAAARCAARCITPRELDVTAFQAELVERGAFDATVLARAVGPQPVIDEVDELITQAVGTVPLHTYSHGSMSRVHRLGIPFVDLVLHPSAEVSDRVAARMSDYDGERQMVLARILVCRGDVRGAEAIATELAVRLGTGDGLPERTSTIKHAQLPPDQAAMPDEAYLLYTLGLARTDLAIPLWESVAARVDTSPAAIRSMTAGTFAYVGAVSFGVERLAGAAAAGAARSLHRRPALRGQSRPGHDPDIFQERQAMLELGLVTALARCGDAEGYEALIGYLGDGRAPLRRQAHSELTLLAGADLGVAPERWVAWLRREATLAPAPLPLGADLHSPDGLGLPEVPVAFAVGNT